jgi:hypothetical protein
MTIPSNIKDAYDAVDPTVPLKQDDARYVDFQEVRGENDEIRAMLRRIDRTRSGSHLCQLFTGHRGCGKTTELFRLKNELEKINFFVVYFDAEETLDVSDLDYPDVLLAIAEQLEAQLRERAGIILKKELLEKVSEWFANITNTDVVSQDSDLGMAGEIGIEVPIFARLLAKVRSEVKNSSQRRTEIRQQLERRSSELIALVNDLIDNAQSRLSSKGQRGLVLLVDGLEKVLYRVLDEKSGLNSHTLLFIYHGEQLRSLRCHLVYTYPINLMIDQNIGQIFTQTTILPMVRIYEPTGQPNEKGFELLRKALANRLDIDAIFTDPALVNKLIEASGGHLRDFLRLVRYAFDITDDVVGPSQVERAINKLTVEYDYLLQADDLERLHRVHASKEIPSDARHALLLYNLLVLEYLNGARWADVHPMVRRLPKFQKSSPEYLARA